MVSGDVATPTTCGGWRRGDRPCGGARVALLVLSLVVGAPGFAADASAQAPAARDRMQGVEDGLLTPVVIRGAPVPRKLTERMAELNVPGVAIAVIHDGRIDWARGYGVKEAGGAALVDTATLFQAASISKPVAALAALRLVEEGRVTLDDDVNGRLVSWRVPENGFTRAAPVTLRRLLSHSAGLTVHGFRGYAAGEAVPTVVQILNGERPANSAAVRADTMPGALWRYSGGGSTVVQLLMQDVTGRTFPDLMREYVLQPAGMMHSTYEQPLSATRAAAAATGHNGLGRAVAGRWHTYPEMFAAGLWTTPSDLARLAIEVQRSLRGQGNAILPAAAMRRMLTLEAGDYGLGFGLSSGDGWSAFHHGGSNQGFRAFLFAFADRGQGAVVMTNGDNGAQLAGEIMRAIAAQYDWPAQRAVERDVVRLDAATLAGFAGDYTFQANNVAQRLTLWVEAGSLRAQGPPLGPATVTRVLHASEPDRFFFVESPVADLRFERDAAGAVTHLVIAGPGQTLRLTRVR